MTDHKTHTKYKLAFFAFPVSSAEEEQRFRITYVQDPKSFFLFAVFQDNVRTDFMFRRIVLFDFGD